VPEPDLAATLRKMKVPENLSASQALRAYLVAQLEGQLELSEDEEQQKQMTMLLLLSHLEVVNALGALEERMNSPQFKKSRRRWF
jgi:hypothetical protein